MKIYIDRVVETFEFTTRVHTINDIGQGFLPTQRIGRTIKIVRIHLRAEVKRNVFFTAPFTWNHGTFRWMVVVDGQRNGTSGNPGVEDLLEVGADITDDVTQPYNLSNRERFTYLVDKHKTFGAIWTAITQTDLLIIPDVTISSEPWVHYIDWCQDVDIDVVYNSDPIATSSAINTNAIYFVYMTNCFSNSIPFPNAFEIRWSAEVSFIDH